MSLLYLDDPLLDPDFYEPGRKPIGPVAMVPDDGLVWRSLFDEGAGRETYNLKNMIAAPFGGTLGIDHVVHPVFGRSLELDGGTTHNIDTGVDQDFDTLTVLIRYDAPPATRGYILDGSRGNGIAIRANGASRWDVFIRNNLGELARVSDVLESTIDGAPHTFGFTFNNKTLQPFFDGLATAATSSTATTAPVGAGGSTIKIGTEYNGAGGLPHINGEVLIVERVLSNDKILAWHRGDYTDLISTQPYIPLLVSSGGLTAVNTDLYLQWDSLASITSDIDLRWQIINAVESDLPLAWDLLNSTTNDLQLSWSTLHALTAELDTRWDIESALTSVSVDLGLQWSTTSAVTSNIDLRWQILTSVDRDIQLTWDLLNSATNDLQLAWDTLNALTANLDTRWSILESVNADLDLQWDIQSALASVAADLGLSWNVHQSITADLTLQWDIRHAIVATLDTRWEILNAVGVDLDMRWHIATAVAADLALQWSGLENISADADLRWNTLEATENSLTLQWSIGGLMLTPISFIAVPAEQRVIPVPHEQRVLPIYH